MKLYLFRKYKLYWLSNVNDQYQFHKIIIIISKNLTKHTLAYYSQIQYTNGKDI